MRKMSVPCEMLLHPELLSNQQLMTVILERHLRVPHIELMNRDQLLELFHDYCVPYGQRRYRDSGRGKMLNKSRNIEDKPEPMKLDVLNYSNSVNLSFKHASERVKAPPDLLSGHIKRIRISVEPDKKTISYVKEDKNKRKMSIDSEIAMEATPPKKGRKPITWP